MKSHGKPFCLSAQIGMFVPLMRLVTRVTGGLGVMWNPKTIELKAYISCAGIILSDHLAGSNHRLCIINSYAPFIGRRQYWDQVTGSGLLGIDSLIIVGDLNFSMGFGEIWV